VAAVVTTLILTGRALENRARRKAGLALRALLEVGAKDVVLVSDGHELRVPIDRLRVGDLFAVDLPRPRPLDVMTTEKFGVYVRRSRRSLNAGGGLE